MSANKQELFNQAVRGLASQDFTRSVQWNESRGERCAYRGEQGRRCALGHLMPDDKYHSSMEGCIPGLFNHDGKRIMVAVGLNPVSYDDREWAISLQNCHDRAIDRQDMIYRLKEFASINKLDFPKLP